MPVKEYPESDADMEDVPVGHVDYLPDVTISRYATEYSEYSNEMREKPPKSPKERGAPTAVAFNFSLHDVEKHKERRVVHDAFCYPRYPIFLAT